MSIKKLKPQIFRIFEQLQEEKGEKYVWGYGELHKSINNALNSKSTITICQLGSFLKSIKTWVKFSSNRRNRKFIFVKTRGRRAWFEHYPEHLKKNVS